MKSLTRKVFLILMLLSVSIGVGSWLLIQLCLPDLGTGSAAMQTKAETLAGELREDNRETGLSAMRQFERETGMTLYLETADRTVLDPFTMTPQTFSEPPAGAEYPFRFAGDTEEYFLIVSGESVRTVQIRRGLLRSIPVLLLLMLLISLLLARLFSYWAVQPIRRVSNIAAHMAELDFSWYCPDIRDDEIGRLSGNLNLLSDKLQEALSELHDRNRVLQDEITLEKERERRRMLFLSGVTHELKTPVAIVIGQLEGMQANIGVYRDHTKYLARCTEIMQSLNDFIREILLVSHLDMTDAEAAPQMNLSEAVTLLAEDYAAYAAEGGIEFHTEIAPEISVFAEPMLLKKALGNILGNAAAHTPAQGTVHVNLHRQEDGGAEMTVENSPAHIGEAHLPHVFDAFYRADSAAKQSSGLGLYITATIFDLYHIPCRIENTADGVLFTVEFPEASL